MMQQFKLTKPSNN